VKTGYLLAAFAACALVCIMALRANYAGMVERRAAVYAADEKGEGVEVALQELRRYVGQHMNTTLDTGKGVYPPIQLKHTYERLVKAEQDRVKTSNDRIYTDAQRYCERQDPNSFFGRERIPCIQKYIKDHPSSKARTIPDALYKFDFTSPRWSPDLAGWSIVLGVALLFLTLLRFTLGRVIKKITR
jgi:hypothetical protein